MFSLLAVASGAHAAEGFADLQRYAFVSGKDAPLVQVIDIEKDQLVGQLDVGLIPRQVALSVPAAKLLAIDGISPRLALADLALRQTNDVPLDFIPQRVVVARKNRVAAVSDLSGGNIAVFDLAQGQVASSISGVGAVSDLIFNAEASRLYIAAGNGAGVVAVDMANGKRMSDSGDASGGVERFTIAPSGRKLYGRNNETDTVSVIDTARDVPPVRIAVTHGVNAVFPTGFGDALMLPDEKEGTLKIVDSDSFKVRATLKGAVEGVPYPAWFDTVAFVPSKGGRKMLIFDLLNSTEAGSISLTDTPGPGAVSADGRKLYLPMQNVKQVVVIDAKERTVAHAVALPMSPSSVIIAGGFGLCH